MIPQSSISIELRSSNAKKASWFVDRQTDQPTLQIVFANNRVYNYFPVEKQKFKDLDEAESQGKWINKHLRQNKKISFEEIS